MVFKKLKENKTLKIISNKYVLILLVFLVWITFFDENSFLVDREFNQEIKKLEADKEFYQSEIEADKKKIEKLEDPEQLDQYAREEYHMKKEEEDIFLIEYDTIEE